MRSNTQTIILDRLQHALSSRGVELKRAAVLEIAAQAFGFQDGNAFVAAMKEGRYDPPAAIATTDDSVPLVRLHDPIAGAAFAVEPGALDPEARRNRFVVSPYGSLLRLPDHPTEASSKSVPSERKIDYVVGFDGAVLDPDASAWLDHLTDTIDVEIDPVLYVEAKRIARIDGRLYFAFEAEEEYADHEAGMLAMASFAEYARKYAPAFERLGGFMRWIDHPRQGIVEFDAFLPVELASKVDDPEDWHDAVSILLGSEHRAVMASFTPQAWQNDHAIDVDPLGETEIDVTFEILTMGAVAARAVRDNREESDEFTAAALAPDWIRAWSGPFHVRVSDEISDYLEFREIHARREKRSEEIWSCANCGETAQDGSGICVTCGHEDESYFS